MFDCDLVAVLNISRRGRVRFARSEGVGVGAMVQEPGPVGLSSNPTCMNDQARPNADRIRVLVGASWVLGIGSVTVAGGGERRREVCGANVLL
jgi:hypothetical protein